jgi:hypothetical protein
LSDGVRDGLKDNPDGAQHLQPTITELGGKTPLLREVGSLRGVGEDGMVFGLGGNVAEWVARKDGKGVLQGSSADWPVDAKQGANGAGLEYRGFRVVKDN